MPREAYTIGRFDRGIISAVEGADLPKESSPWSIDQDCEGPLGVLRGRNNDEAFVSHASRGNNAQAYGWIVREDGKRDLIYYDAANGDVKYITDFHGTKGYGTSFSPGTGKTVSIESVNRGVRVAVGDADVKFIGYIDHEQFGGSVPSGLQCVDAKLSNQTSFPYVHKMVGQDSLYGYAIEWQGKKVFKVTLSSGAFVLSERSFGSLQGICEDGTYIYVYDASIGTYGTLYKLNQSLEVETSYPLSGFGSVGNEFGGTQAGIVTDIELSADNSTVWFTGVPSIPITAASSWNEAGSKFIFSQDISSLNDGQSIVPVDRTPSMALDVSEGRFKSTGIVRPAMRGFVKLTTGTEIGIFCSIEQNVYYDGTASDGKPYLGILILNTSFVVSSGFNSANSRFIAVDATNMVPSPSAPDSWSPINAIYCPNGSGEDVLVIADNANLLTEECALADNKNLTIGAAGSAFAWDASGWKTISVDDDSEAIDDELTNASIMFNKYDGVSELNECYVFPAYQYHDDPLTVNVDQSPRMYKLFIGDDASFSAEPHVYVKRSDAWITAEINNNEPGSLGGKVYFYKYAFIYDGYQYSPLENFNEPFRIIIGSGSYSTRVTVTLRDNVLNARITDVAIFRAEAASSTSLRPTTSYRLINTISLRQKWALNSSGKFSDFYQESVYDTGNFGGAYETESGIDASNPNNFMRYSISAQGNGYFFVGQCFNEEFDDNSLANFLFRSKQNAPDTYDWSTDFLVLPTKPVALHFFRGLLYAFDVARMYVIDPNNFQIIQVVEGMGVEDQRCVVSNETAMFFGNRNNAYMHDGKTPTIISTPVNVSSDSTIGGTAIISYRATFVNSYEMSIAIHSKRNLVLFCFSKTGASTYILGFHYPTGSWYFWQFASSIDGTILPNGTGKKMVLVDGYGQAYLSTAGGLLSINSAATYKACTWYSHIIDGGTVNAIKKFYMIILDGTAGTTKQVAYNGSTTFSTDFTSGTYLDTTTKRSSMWIKLVLTTTDTIRGLTVLYRKMIGERA